MNLEEKLEQSRFLAIQLSALKKKEMELRIEIADELAPDGTDPGTHNFEFGGMKVKLKLGLNYSFDKDELDAAIEDDRLSEEELDLIRWKADLKLGDYKKADFGTEDLDDCIIVKPSAPTLTIELGETT